MRVGAHSSSIGSKKIQILFSTPFSTFKSADLLSRKELDPKNALPPIKAFFLAVSPERGLTVDGGPNRKRLRGTAAEGASVPPYPFFDGFQPWGRDFGFSFRKCVRPRVLKPIVLVSVGVASPKLLFSRQTRSNEFPRFPRTSAFLKNAYCKRR